MNVFYAVFDKTTGEVIKIGNAPPEMVSLQAQEGQVALITEDLTVGGNRLARWEEVKTIRAQKIEGGCATPWGTVQTDELSRSNISGAALAAVIAKSASSAFSIVWTLADNSAVTLNADETINLGLIVMKHVNDCYIHARELREEIDAATNMAELLAIDVASGWPA